MTWEQERIKAYLIDGGLDNTKSVIYEHAFGIKANELDPWKDIVWNYEMLPLKRVPIFRNGWHDSKSFLAAEDREREYVTGEVDRYQKLIKIWPHNMTEYPLVILCSKEGRFFMLDGYHRRAMADATGGIESVPVIVGRLRS